MSSRSCCLVTLLLGAGICFVVYALLSTPRVYGHSKEEDERSEENEGVCYKDESGKVGCSVGKEDTTKKSALVPDKKEEQVGKKKPYTGPDSCCKKLLINGTLNNDPWYQNMMGIFTVDEELPWIFYEKKGDITGKYPVYIHTFVNFEPTEERPDPPKVYLYYYINEVKAYPETECKERGCWAISMYDPMPGNFWFGKKWYFIRTNPTPKCPDELTENGARFLNQDHEIDPGMTIKCLDDEK